MDQPKDKEQYYAEAFEWAGDKSIEELDFEAKRDHGGAAFWVFFIASPFLFWLVKPRPTGWMVPLYCLAGAFAIPLASIVTFVIKMKLAVRLTPQQAVKFQLPWAIFDTSYSIFMSWLLFVLLARL